MSKNSRNFFFFKVGIVCGVKARAERYLGSSLPSHVQRFKITMQTNWQTEQFCHCASECVRGATKCMCKCFSLLCYGWLFFLSLTLSTLLHSPSLYRRKKSPNYALCVRHVFFCNSKKYHTAARKQSHPLENMHSICFFVYTKHKIWKVNIVFVALFLIIIMMAMQL